MHKVSSVYAHQLTRITEITQYIMAVMFFNIYLSYTFSYRRNIKINR